MVYNNEIERDLCDRMDNLLQEAREKGYCFEFNMECSNNCAGLITIWTDDDSFCFDVIKPN